MPAQHRTRRVVLRALAAAIIAPGLASTLIASDAAGSPSSAAGHAAPLRRVGNLDLQACGAAGAYCGDLERALDPSGAVLGQISVHFEWYPHTRTGKSLGTLVATEGGPGFPATLSREDYLTLFRPLMSQRDVLIMDNRGTGQSGAIDCHELQTAETWSVASVAGCGESLGNRASLYSTVYATDDLAAILAALGVAQIDLYGDSYGTYFEQVFAVRHPAMLRSVVLDGAYPLTGPDYAWYPNYAPAMRVKFNLACARSAPCAGLPGTSIDHILLAIEALRAHPFAAKGFDVNGKERRFQADASQLAIVMFGSAPAFTTAREVDAAARAFVQDDPLPLLRLMAETVSAVDSRDPNADATKWSAGLAAAVMCQDPPQVFDMRLPPAERARDRDRALAERRQSHPNTYSPFTIDEYRAMPLDYSYLDQCVGWPVAPPGQPASQVGVNAIYPDVPALVISGEFDSITTPAEGAAVAGAFKRGVHVVIANSFHVNALPRGRSACAADIVRRFLARLTTGDTACASQVPPLRLVSRFAMLAGELEPAAGRPGNSAPRAQLQWVTAAVLTVGDVLARVDSNSTGSGVGLRGGKFTLSRGRTRIRVQLDHVRWVNDLGVSGIVDRPVGRRGMVKAIVQVAPTDAAPTGGRSAARASAGDSPRNDSLGRLSLQWIEGVDHAVAEVRGAFAATKVMAHTAAP